MVDIQLADPIQDASQIREIFWEYLQWVNLNLQDKYGFSLDMQSIVDGDMQDFAKFMPPLGRLLLGFVDGQLAGIACMVAMDELTREIRRMYVRPAYRRFGLGRALIARLLQEAVQAGFKRVRLDSARFMVEAHGLYRSIGFREIDPYPGSEIPIDFQPHWLFMELDF